MCKLPTNVDDLFRASSGLVEQRILVLSKLGVELTSVKARSDNEQYL